jgi:sigma-E factor negative regulatory protein RseA
MSEQLRESLSAAMDGEADAFELRRVLDEAKQDDALREQWHRFHLVRDVLCANIKHYHPDLRERIWSGLNEPVDDADSNAELVLAAEAIAQGDKRSPWVGRITGTAVAAAVAVAVMLNGGVFEDQAPSQELVGTGQLPGGGGLEPVMYSQATPVDQQRQNALMLHHIQQRGMNQAGVASFVKLATFNTKRLAPVPDSASEEETPAP